MRKLILVMVVVIAIAGCGCMDRSDTEIIQTPILTPTPTPTPIPVESGVRTIDITVNYKVETMGIILYEDSYAYRLENTPMTDDEIRVMVGEKVKEVAQDKNVNLDWITYNCSIEVVR